MTDNKINLHFLSSNALKIIAAITMLIDHIGYIFFPHQIIFRIIGRITFPIFAFMISEGCHYTKNKLRYFLGIFSLAAVCQITYFIFDNSLYMSVLVTFSLSILVIYALQNFKENLFSPTRSYGKIILSGMVFIFAIAAVYGLNIYLRIDYGFWGCMTPVFANLFKNTKKNPSAILEKTDHTVVHVLMVGIVLSLLAINLRWVQHYSLLALPLLMLYSGKRGKYKMKYFFYIFYPTHLVILEAIYYLLKMR